MILTKNYYIYVYISIFWQYMYVSRFYALEKKSWLSFKNVIIYNYSFLGGYRGGGDIAQYRHN